MLDLQMLLEMLRKRQMMMQRNQNGFPMQMPSQQTQGIPGVNGEYNRMPMFNIPYPPQGGIRG